MVRALGGSRLSDLSSLNSFPIICEKKFGACNLTHTKLGCVAQYTNVSDAIRSLRVKLLWSNPPMSGFTSCLCTKSRSVPQCTNAHGVVHSPKVKLVCPHPPVSGFNFCLRTGVRKSVVSNLSGTTGIGSARKNHAPRILDFWKTAIFGIRVAERLSTWISDPRGHGFESRLRRIRLEQDLIDRVLSLSLWIIARSQIS